MELSELKVGELLSLLTALKPVSEQHPYRLGQAVLIRTVTHYTTGRIKDVFAHEIVLEDAAWIADTGRFYDALKEGTLSEVEPIQGLVIIGRGSIVDVFEWVHELPRTQK